MIRRVFLQLLGVAPIAAPRILEAQPPIRIPIASPPDLIAKAVEKAFVSPEMKAAREAFESLRRKRRRMLHNTRYIEPSIACMKSWSRAYKLLVHDHLMEESDTILNRLEDIAWPDHNAGSDAGFARRHDAQRLW